ncbi:MAG TPA: hypothetical protein VK016_01945 [Arenimonas sp.]|nr:hypothetical protein [Arenimonas sp.]
MPSSRLTLPLALVLLGLVACQSESPSPADAAVAAARAHLRGQVAYPSEYIPAMRVCAIAADDPGTGYCAETAQNAPEFDLAVPAGHWWLAAWPLEDAAGDPGLLSNASDCIARADAGCDDHALLSIPLAAGETRAGLPINDWYYDPREFPPPMQPRPAPR